VSLLATFNSRAFVGVLFFASVARCQVAPPPAVEEPPAVTISEPFHVQWYPQILQSRGPVPVWMNGYLIRPQSQNVSGESNIPLYDAKGNLERQGRITHPGAAKIILLDAAVTPNGIILGAATAYTDETTVSFVAKTDRDGEEVETVELGDFWPMRICGWKENEVWVYGRDLREDEPGKEVAYPLLRRYVFGQGLVRGVLPRNSVALQQGGSPAGPGSHGTYLDCKEDRVRLYITQTNEYVEIDTDRAGDSADHVADVRRWKMDMTAFPDGAVTGFAVTDDSRVFASIYLDVADSQQTVRRGLYEIRTRTGDVTGHWLQVKGTESSRPLQGSAQPGTFWKLWGADGKTLVVNMAKSGDLAWVKIVN